MSFERVLRWALVSIAIVGLAAGILAYVAGRPGLADLCWTLATAPVVAGLAVSIVRDFLAGRFGVDAVALVSMSAAIALGQPLAGAVVALMYSGGNVLEDLAIARAEHDLRSLLDRAPREAHRCVGDRIEDVPIGVVAAGDQLLVRAGEVVPVDGVVTSSAATIDESALTGEPIPVVKARGGATFSGSLNSGETFEMTASSVAGESTYAGIVRLVTAAQTAKAPFVRLADRYALIFLPVTLVLAFAAWLISGDLIRSLAVLVAATPCPLILAAPVAFIAGVAQAARRGILVKGGGPLEALARAHTVLFDKTGTLTVGGARLLSVEVAPSISTSSADSPGATSTESSRAPPTVSVPVLSNSTVWARASASSGPPPLTRMPRRAACATPAIKATGAARIRGQGVAATSTARARMGSPETTQASAATAIVKGRKRSA